MSVREVGRRDPAASGTADWARSSVWSRGGFLAYFAAIGAFTPYATLYYRDLGFGGLEVGVLAALPALGAALIGPLVGTVSDARASHGLVLRAALVLAAAGALVATQVASFWPLALLVGLLALAQAPIAPLLDAYAVTIADRRGTSYGGLRVWGSIGYTLAALLVGLAMGERVTALVLVVYASCLVFGLLASLRLPRLGERSPRPLLAGFGPLVRNRPLALLLLVAYLVSSSASIMYGFLGIHLQGLGGSAGIVGVAVAVAAVSELAVVAWGGKLLSRLGAPRAVMLAIAVYGVRFAAYALIPSPGWVLPIQLAHGLSFGAFLVASVTLAHRLAGPAHAAGAQALLTAVSFGFGSITGSLIGGALLDRVGTGGLFGGASALMLLTLLGVLVAVRRAGAGWAEWDGERSTAPPTRARTGSDSASSRPGRTDRRGSI